MTASISCSTNRSSFRRTPLWLLLSFHRRRQSMIASAQSGRPSAPRVSRVALTPLPQADGRTKPRPAILLRQIPPFGDWLVCGVSTQLHHEVVGFDETIEPSHPDFLRSGSRLLRLSGSVFSSFFLPSVCSEFLAPSHPSATRVCSSDSAHFSNRNEAPNTNVPLVLDLFRR